MKAMDSGHYLSEKKYDAYIDYLTSMIFFGLGFVKPLEAALKVAEYTTFAADTAEMLSYAFDADETEVKILIDTVLDNNPDITFSELLVLLETNGQITEEDRTYIMNWETFSTVLTSTDYGIDSVIIQNNYEHYTGMYSDGYYSANSEMYEINDVLTNLYNYENGSENQKDEAREFLEPYFSPSTDKGENLDSAIQGFINLSFKSGGLSEYNFENFTEDGRINADDIISTYNEYESTYSEIQDLIDKSK